MKSDITQMVNLYSGQDKTLKTIFFSVVTGTAAVINLQKLIL